jgi:hypothetical protein
MDRCEKLTTILSISFEVTSGEVLEAYTKLVGTKADILNGRGTASPVSGCILEFTTTSQLISLAPPSCILQTLSENS